METKNESDLPSRKKLFAAFGYVFVGVLSTAILVVGTHAAERTREGQDCEFWMFGLLQRALSDFDPANPIVLIDIGDVSENSGDLLPVVKETVGTLKTLRKRPIAIAVDVDFSPTGALSNDATEFFDACLKKPGSDDVPVFLGAGDNKAALPEEWLGLEEYKDLAAAVAINEEDTRWIPIWVQANNGEKLKTLNYALALEYPSGLPGPASWIAWAVDRGKEGGAVTRERGEVESDEITLNYGERLVNYSKLETMQRVIKTAEEARLISNDNTSYSGKLVIIGDVNGAKDKFSIPGPRGDKAGSLLLASSTYTLIKEPLFEFKSNVKLGLDLFIAGIIVFLVAFIRYKYPSESAWVGKQAICIYVSIIVVIITGFALVRFARVIWPDFLFVLFALFLHPKVERLVHPILDRLIRLVSKLKSLRRSRPPAPGPVASAVILVFCASIMTASVHAQQQPADLCQRGIGAVVLELKSESKAKKKKETETCQYCDANSDTWHGLSQGDIRKQFRPGQRLRCSKRCTLVIFVCGSGRKQSISYMEGKTAPGSYTVINPYRIPRKIFDRFPQKPGKNLKWAYHVPGNPDPRLYARANTESSNAAFLGNWMQGSLIRDLENAKLRAAIGQASPTPDGSQSQAAAATASAATSSAQATPTPTPFRGEQIARVSSPNTAAAASPTAAARTSGDISAGTSASKTSLAEERIKRFDRFIGLLAKGNIARDAKNYAEAQAAYSEAKELVPSDPRSWYGLGNVYFDQKKWTEAEDEYLAARLLGAYSSDLYLSLANLLVQSQEDAPNPDRLAQAEQYLWIAARLEPRNEKTYALLDVVLKKRGAKTEELESTYRRALGLNSSSVDMNLRLAELLLPVHRKEAKKHFKIAEKAARTPEELLDVATSLEARHKVDKAERFCRRALGLEHSNARAPLLLGLVLIDRDKYSAALRWLQDAVKNNPDDFEPRYLSAIAHLQTGNLDQSELSLDEAATRISSEEESNATFYWSTRLGDAYFEKGRKSEAVRVYEKALKQNPDDLETRHKLTAARSSIAP